MIQITRGKLDCLFTTEVRSFRALLVLLYPVIKFKGKAQQSNSSRMTRGTAPSGMKAQVTPPGKGPRPAEVRAEGGGNKMWERKVVICTT